MIHSQENVFESVEGQWERNLNDARLAIESESPPETLKSVLTLMKFNELSHNYEDSIASTAEHRKKRLQEIEEVYRLKSQIIPTIGTELEVPLEVISDEQKLILDKIGIRCQTEEYDVIEIAPFYSYSASTQSRMLQEYVYLGINQENIRKEKQIDTSLHLNFGVPQNINPFSVDFLLETRVLTDAITYGFTPPERIFSRKTHSSRELKPAWKGLSAWRLELRTPDFSSTTTFRMLEEVQLLTAACFAHLRDLSDQEISEEELKLSSLWTEFVVKVKSLLDENGLNISEEDGALYDVSPSKTFRLLSGNPTISKSFREVITKTSKKIKEIVQLDI